MIQRSKDRIRQNGEVFTPPQLVQEILAKLPPELFSDPTKTFIDPACGDGNFLVEVVKLKLKNGSTPTQALSTTYGVDIMTDNVERCRARLLELCVEDESLSKILATNIVVHDALTYDYEFNPQILLEDYFMDSRSRFRPSKISCSDGDNWL